MLQSVPERGTALRGRTASTLQLRYVLRAELLCSAVAPSQSCCPLLVHGHHKRDLAGWGMEPSTKPKGSTLNIHDYTEMEFFSFLKQQRLGNHRY